MSDFLIGLAVVALFGFGVLLIWLWEVGWLLPITVATAVVAGLYFVGPWLREKPVTLSADAPRTAAINSENNYGLPPGYVWDGDTRAPAVPPQGH